MVQNQDGHHCGPGHCKTEYNGGHFVNHWKTEPHWKTEQTPTIWIPNVFSIPAPTTVNGFS